MRTTLPGVLTLFFLSCFSYFSAAQTTNTYTSATTWTVPAGVSSVTIKVYGGAGGTGGQDCGAGCSNTAASNAGYIDAFYTVTAGDIIGIYPGARGTDGSNSVTGSGGGAGGADSYPSGNYNGGTGGNAGPSGSSGGGGGGGAASLVTINGTIRIVAGGGGGGGGMANMANSGWAGNSSPSSNGTNAGGNGVSPGGDGGGGGAGGGGQFASAGGNVHAAGGESAGDGGYRGGNAVSGASLVNTNGTVVWTLGGRIDITYVSTLPVSWLNFTAAKQNKTLVLRWSTASEQHTADYTVERSLNRIDWLPIGTVVAAGTSNSIQQYSFTDQAPGSKINYYRLLQRDIDNSTRYSKVIAADMSLENTGVRIFPNPLANGSGKISLPEDAVVRVYSSTGEKVFEKPFPAGTHPLHLTGIAPGAYYLKVNEERIPFLLK